MRSDLAGSTLISALLWSMLLLSLFAAPALMAARDGGIDEVDGHTADLIRQHQEAMSPFSSAPEMPEQQLQSNACGRPDNQAMSRGETSLRDTAPVDEPMIRPVGNRAGRIQV